MEKIDFKIDKEDLQILFLKTREYCKNQSFEIWKQECEKSFSEYHKRNSENLEKYGIPKTYSQWVNGQIISLN